jgi:hypothetical protein
MKEQKLWSASRIEAFRLLQHVIPAKAGIQRLTNIYNVYMGNLHDESVVITGFQPSLE